MEHEPELRVFAATEELVAAAAEQIAASLERAVPIRGAALVALSGGTLPPAVFRLLCDEPLRGRIPWAQLSIIWCDERAVPFDHPDSSYKLARETLLDHVPIPSIQVYPVATYYPPVEAAARYDRQVAALLEAHGGAIDLALLGVGPDGHTASLFPGFPQLDAPPGTLALNVDDAPKPPPQRITLTAEALNHSREALFLVAGADKAAKVRAALRGPYEPHATPAQLVRPPDGRVIWLLDQAAAAEL